jgi:hypothetical protein
MIGAPKIVRITTAINTAKEKIVDAEERVVGLLQSKGEGVSETCEEAYVDLEDAVHELDRAMSELDEEIV